MAMMHVEFVSVERPIWSGEATAVMARTTEGDLAVLPGHAPLLGELAGGGVVRVDRNGEGRLIVAVHGGFLSVTKEGVSILAELAELADEVDVERATRALEAARASDDPDAKDAEMRALSRLRAAGVQV